MPHSSIIQYHTLTTASHFIQGETFLSERKATLSLSITLPKIFNEEGKQCIGYILAQTAYMNRVTLSHSLLNGI